MEWDRDRRSFQETGRPEPRRYLASWLPFLPTDRLRRQAGRRAQAGRVRRPSSRSRSIRGALALAAVDRNAMRFGLAAGLTLADARARIPDLAVVEADPDADARFLDRLATLCDRFTPLVALRSAAWPRARHHGLRPSLRRRDGPARCARDEDRAHRPVDAVRRRRHARCGTRLRPPRQERPLPAGRGGRARARICPLPRWRRPPRLRWPCRGRG